MEITNEKIELNGLIHKGVDKILILMVVLSVVYGIVFTLLEKMQVARIVSAFLPVAAIIAWILFIFLRIDKLKVENGVVSLNGENIDGKNTTGYMDKYVGTPRLHLTVNGEKILFEPYVNRYSRSDTSNKITAIGFFLKEKGIAEIQYQKIYRKILLLRLIIILGIMAPLIITV